MAHKSQSLYRITKLSASTLVLCAIQSLSLAQYTLAPDVIPSADATSLGKYGYFPVSYYTGQANVSIPVCELSANGVDMRLSLDYDGSGIMVDVHPGWVGQNWTLNGGGIITRSVQGRADEEGLTQGGFYYNNRVSYISAVSDASNWFSEDSTNSFSELQDFALDRVLRFGKPVDTEPDIFNFNFLGITGKFYLSNDGTWKVISEHNLRIVFDLTDTANYISPFIEFIPGSLGFRKYEDVIAGFKIIDERGYTYSFGYDTSAIEYSHPFFRQYAGTSFFGDPDWTATAWHLTKIEDYRGNEIYSLEYERSFFTARPHENRFSTTSGCVIAVGDTVCCSSRNGQSGSGSLISPVYLTKITNNKSEAIEFRTSTTNQLPLTWTSVFISQAGDINDALASCATCSTFPFLQEMGYYSYDPLGSNPNPFNGLMWLKLDSILVYSNSTHLIKVAELEYNNDPDERLNLQGIDFIGSDLYSNPQPEEYGYEFSYNNFGQLPNYFARKIDHFGYYNGIDDITSNFDPEDYFDYDALDTTYFDSRVSVEDSLLVGQLEEILYPTGGTTEFDYEINDYSTVISNDRQSSYQENGVISGLRIKEIRNYDAIGETPATAKTYHYNLDFELGGTASSGILALKPQYVWIDWLFPSDFWPSGGYIESSWSTNFLVPLGNKFESHIGYRDVIEENLDGSYTIHSFNTHLDIPDDLPYANLNLDYSQYARFSDKSHMRGRTTSIRHFDASDDIVLSEEMFYTDSTEIAGFDEYAISVNAGFNQSCPESNFDRYYRGNAIYIYHNKYVPDSIRSRQYFGADFIETTNHITYSKPVLHGNKYAFEAERRMVNSDGNVYADNTEYTFNNTSGVSGQQVLLNALADTHRLVPVLQLRKVNDTIVDGMRYLYDDGWGSVPEIHQMDRFEVTWNDGTYTGEWDTQSEILDYDLTFLRPIEQQTNGWEIEEITLTSNGRISSWNYSDHNKYWNYLSNDFLEDFIDIDSLEQRFTYDEYLRLKTLTEIPKNVVHTYSYDYSDSPADRSFFRMETKFPLVDSSAIDSIILVSYLDGLGREIQMVNKYASPLQTADVISGITYDALGRVYREYEPVEVNANDGDFYQGNFNGGFTQQLYLDDPLNRISQRTPPEWYSSNFSYSTNQSPLTSPAGTIYPANSLHIEKVLDPDGNATEQLKDRRGRVVLTRTYLGTDTTQTWTVYDNKDRPIRIFPPGSSPSTPNLLFTYKYDGDDNVVYRKMPDCDPEEFRFDERNLETARQNPILDSLDRWLVTQYDVYGRISKRGFQSSSGEPDNVENPTIDVLLEERFYDGFNGTSTASSPVYVGRLKRQRVKMLDNNAINSNWTDIEYFYDAFGRITTTASTNHLGGTETTMHTYDYADNSITLIHNVSGSNGVNHVLRNTYDHQGRLKFNRVNLDGQGLETVGLNIYNHKSEIIERNIGRFATTGNHQYLQSLDYKYNAQGWLTSLNDLFFDPILEPPDPCAEPPNNDSDDLPSTLDDTDDQDLFALGIEYDTTITGSGIPVSRNGNITTLKWWQNPGYTQAYSFRYDFLNRVTTAIHGEYDIDEYERLDNFYEKFQYDSRGNILTCRRKGLIQRPEIDTLCFSASTIDSLTYTYENGTNKLIHVQDDAPCEDVVTLPRYIERDMTFAALIEIRVDRTEVLCGVDLTLISDDLNIADSLNIRQNCDSIAFVDLEEGPCPDNRFTYGFNQQSLSGHYLYDDSGNLIYDPNKQLTFHYNFLNLPYMIVGVQGDTLFTNYGADGTLLQRTYKRDDSTYWKRDYIQGKEFFNDTLNAVYHSDGRAVKEDNNWSYEYWIRDHLGSIRVTFADKNNDGTIINSEILTRQDYYCFGLEHKLEKGNTVPVYDTPRYLYNEKELLEIADLDLLDYGARLYDPSIGRFTATDHFAAKYSFQSPYAYAASNPIKFVDINGDSIKINGVTYLPGATYNGDDQFVSDVFEALNYIAEHDADVQGVIAYVATSDNIVQIVPNNDENNPYESQRGSSFFNANYDIRTGQSTGDPFIVWDSNKGVKFNRSTNHLLNWIIGKGKRSPAEVLLHELGHVRSFLESPTDHAVDSQWKDKQYGTSEERDVILGIENPAAIILGGVPRHHHRGVFYPVSSPTSKN